MLIHMDEEKRSAEIRLTKAESDDPAVEANAGNRKKSGLTYGTVSHVFRIIPLFLQTIPLEIRHKERKTMKATGIVRRVDDLGRIVIPKEIRRTLRIREGDPLHTTLTPIDRFCISIHSFVQRITAQ